MSTETNDKKQKLRLLSNALISIGFLILMVGFYQSLTTGFYSDRAFAAGMFNMGVGWILRWRNR